MVELAIQHFAEIACNEQCQKTFFLSTNQQRQIEFVFFPDPNFKANCFL